MNAFRYFHSGHEVASKQMNGFGGVLSFEVEGGVQAGITVVEVTIFKVFRSLNLHSK